MDRKECYNLDLINYEYKNGESIFIIDVNTLFKIEVILKIDTSKTKDLKEIIITSLYETDPDKIIKTNEKFIFTLSQIFDINYKVIFDYYNLKKEEDILNYLNNNYLGNEKFIKAISNYYTLSVLKKAGATLQLYI